MSESTFTVNGAPPNKKRRRDRNRGGKKNVFNGDVGTEKKNINIQSVFDIESRIGNSNNAANNGNSNGNNKKNKNKNKSKNNNNNNDVKISIASNNNTNNIPNVMSLSSIEDKEKDVDENMGMPSAEEKKHFITESKFADLPISDESKRGIAQVLKYEYMTKVQEETLPEIMKGIDCLAKAKTGTGKTLGFLIPTIEKLMSLKLSNHNYIHNDGVTALCLSPTRELASQIQTEAEALSTFHKLNIVCIIGGTNINKDINRMKNKKVDLLIATPGRLNDHLANTPGFASRCKDIKVLIMDEADQLLEMGFKPEIDKILTYMPPKNERQTLLFSATVPPTVRAIADNALGKGYALVDTVGEEAEQTHAHVPQSITVLPLEEQIAGIASIISKFTQSKRYKIIVFFTTARVTGYMSELFNTMGLPCPVLEIHSRKSQSQRTKTSDEFRKPGNKIMFSSDVSARGMDYPDVTHVLQVGLTEREQYIHRLGRTARAGKTGQGHLLLAPFEEHEMRKLLKDMKLIVVNKDDLNLDSFTSMTTNSLSNVDNNSNLKDSASKAYGAWLGFYNGNLKKCGWDKPNLVQQANFYATTLGLSEQPALEKKTIGKMGLKGVPGLKIGDSGNGGRGGGGRGGGGRGGGGGFRR